MMSSGKQCGDVWTDGAACVLPLGHAGLHMADRPVDRVLLSSVERERLSEVLGSITLTPDTWTAPGHMDKVADAVGRIVAGRLASRPGEGVDLLQTAYDNGLNDHRAHDCCTGRGDRSPDLHRCEECGLELDGDDPNSHCDECLEALHPPHEPDHRNPHPFDPETCVRSES